MAISRRDLLKKSLGYVTVSAIAPRFSISPGWRSREILSAANPSRILVVLELMGGNDGLNTVVPYSDANYPKARSRIGVDLTKVLDLDSHLALNPVMTGLKSLWDAGRVAIVEGVGYPNPNLSHFASRDIWHLADPTLEETRGWLGRWADGALADSDNPLACCAISQSLPKTLLSDSVLVPTFTDLASYSYATDGQYPGDAQNQLDAFLAENGSRYEIESTPRVLSRVGSDAIASSNSLGSVAGSSTPPVPYPDGTLGAAMQLVAQIIAGKLGSRILYVTFGGFDNHANEDRDHDGLLASVSDSVSAFFADLDARGLSGDVLLMTWSEFGRRVADNASNGTDHGTAAPHFVVGDAVRKGIYGNPPNLASLDPSGNLVFQNDFRAYYGTILSDWLGADSAAILGSGWPNLGFLNAS
jgi:uncharacterized protein (DUF1501 family)